jgi:NAD(P)-dependent dehydrogenase (short-subunit alcohol dehydrogenase family)
MKIRDSVALVTGANRGLGAAFAHGLLAAGAAKVYAAARDPRSVKLSGVVAVRLDVTQPEQVAKLVSEQNDGRHSLPTVAALSLMCFPSSAGSRCPGAAGGTALPRPQRGH